MPYLVATSFLLNSFSYLIIPPPCLTMPRCCPPTYLFCCLLPYLFHYIPFVSASNTSSFLSVTNRANSCFILGSLPSVWPSHTVIGLVIHTPGPWLQETVTSVHYHASQKYTTFTTVMFITFTVSHIHTVTEPSTHLSESSQVSIKCVSVMS